MKRVVWPFALGVLFTAVFLSVCASNRTDAKIGLRVSAADPQHDRASRQDDIAVSRQNAITRAVAEVSPAVVSINVTQLREFYTDNPFMNDPFWRQFFKYDKVLREVHGLGSGFLFTKDGHILTNQHVVDNADKITVTLTGGEKFDAELIGEDFRTDLAVIKIKSRDFPFLRLGDSDDILIGEWAIAVGNPFGLFDMAAKPTVTVGVVSAVDVDFGKLDSRRDYEDMIQTDASINSGNSGGPLINAYGEVIGINTFIFSNAGSGGISTPLGFAIPINRVKTVVADIIQFGSVQRDWWTQIQFDDLTPMVAFYLRLNAADGVIVTSVERKSPWQEAGLESEDVILEIEGKAIKSKKDIERVKNQITLKKGDSVSMKVYRNRRIYRVEVTF